MVTTALELNDEDLEDGPVGNTEHDGHRSDSIHKDHNDNAADGRGFTEDSENEESEFKQCNGEINDCRRRQKIK